MSVVIELTQGVWAELPINKAGLVRHKSGKGQIVYAQLPSTPVVALEFVPVVDKSQLGELVPIDGVTDENKVYALAIGHDCTISVTPLQSATAPDGIYTGERAVNMQSYTESNVKLGLQYYLKANWPDGDKITNGTPRNIIFQTGSKPVIVKTRIVSYVGEEFQLEIFSNPTFSGGTPKTVGNYNVINPVPTTVTVLKDADVTVDGVVLDDEPDFYYGGTTGNRNAQAIPDGRERVLPPNSTFMVRVSSNVGSGRFSYFLDWFEGEPDLPLS